MGQPATGSAATARDVIAEIVRNMREGLEPLHYSVLPPAVFLVYLHPDDLERLRPILPRMEQEARRALDEEIEALNRATMAEKLKLARRPGPKVSPPEGGWQIRFLEAAGDEAQAGDIVVDSELALPAKAELGAGSMTKRIATRRMGGQATSAAPRYVPATPPESVGEKAWAVIDYEESGGRKQFRVVKDQVVIGRGGRDYWTDLKLEGPADVSREHVRLRRDPASGQFFLKDVSRLGTTVNGARVPSSIAPEEEGRRDRNLETPLPAAARIGLAEVVFLDFRQTEER